MSYIFFLLILASCSPSVRQWELQENVAVCPNYRIAKLFLPAKNNYCGLEVELARGQDGIKMYVNVFSLPIPLNEDVRQTSLTYFIDNDPHPILAWRLEGGQRVLIPGPATSEIISALMSNQEVRIVLGRYSEVILLDNFAERFRAFCEN